MEVENYSIRERTPVVLRCIVVGCPAIYDVQRLTPENMRCVVGACPEIYELHKDNYIIIGKMENPKAFGLEGKVGSGEVLISVPKKLIDEKI